MDGRITALALVLLIVTSAVTVSAATPGETDVVESQNGVGAIGETLDAPQDGSLGGGNDDGGNATTVDQRAGTSADGGVSHPADDGRPGIPYSVNRPSDPTQTFEQPDGVTFEALFWSAGVTAGWRTADGYTILAGEDGYWYYATRSDGRLVPSSARVGIDQVPASIPTGLAPSTPTGNQVGAGAATDDPTADGATVGVDAVPSTGTQSIPLVMINFSDTSTSYSPPGFQSLLFGDDPGIATGPGSVTDYYEEVSSGQLTLTGNVSGWETADNSQSYYGSGGVGDGGSPTGAAKLVKEAAQKADDQIDFAQYDNDGDCEVDQFAVTHQGGGQEATGNSEDIWSHRWFLSAGTGSAYASDDSSPGCGTIFVNGYTIQPETFGGQMATIGVYAHEFGHGLGLPDLYDTDGGSAGIGNWGLMGSGSYGEVIRPGDAPNHMTAWSKAYLGWLDPVEVTTGETRDDVTLNNVSKNNDSLKLLNETNNKNGEYFYVENRQEVGFDQGLPGEGLLVTHVNESRIADGCFSSNSCNADEDNKLVDVEAADGNEDMDDNLNRGDAGDPWNESASPFDDTSDPSSKYDNGTSSNATVSAIQFSNGPTQGTATFDVSAGATANFTVDVDTTNAPVVEGERLSVVAAIENTGDSEDTETVTLDVGTLGSNSTEVTVDGGNSTPVPLSVETSGGDAGEYTATVATAGDDATATVTVLTQAAFEVSNLTAPDEGSAGASINVSAAVTNVGGAFGTQDVAFVFDGTTAANTTVELNASETTTIEFTDVQLPGDAGTYEHGVFTENDSQTANITITGPGPSNVTMTNLSIAGRGDDVTVVDGSYSASVEVTHDDSPGGEIRIELTIGNRVTSENVSLNATETRTVTFENATIGVDPGLYEVTMAADNATATGNLTLSVDVNGNGDPATDPTGDGLLNDVDGDGEFDIFDVQTLFENYNRPVVQTNTELFDFDDDGPVDIFDVQRLFNQLP